MTVTFINPVAECLVSVNPYRLAFDPTGPATIGLVANKIVDCDVFMGLVGEAITAHWPHLSIKQYPTGTITFADDTLMDQVAAECDAAVCAIGHCGSCTAGTVKDGIALVERDIPTVSLVTEIFWDQANALARSLGWPDYPRVKLPYPVWGIGANTMSAIADQTAMQIMPLLESPAADAA